MTPCFFTATKSVDEQTFPMDARRNINQRKLHNMKVAYPLHQPARLKAAVLPGSQNIKVKIGSHYYNVPI